MSESRFVDSFDGRRIAYRVYGEGTPTVLFSNGIGCNQAYINHVIRALSTQYRTVIWDYRGHVDSDKPFGPDELTVDVCIRDMEAVVAAAKISDVVLAGFSMGVQIALEYLGRHDEKVRGMMCLLGTYEYPLRTFFHFGRTGERILPWALSAMSLRPAWSQRIWNQVLSGPWVFPVAKLLVLNPRTANHEDFESWRGHMACMDAKTFVQMGINLGGHSAAHVLPRIRVPTLVVAGDRDNFTPIHVCRRMHKNIKGSEWFPVRGASHGGLFEIPEIINARVLDFMKQHFGEGNASCP